MKDNIFTNTRVILGVNSLPLKKYDLIVTLGYGFVGNWKLSEHVKKRNELVAKLYKNGVSKKIAACGKWAMKWDKEGITPPTTEATEIKNYLIQLGVKPKDIWVEDQSKDSIGNAFFLKKNYVKNSDIQSLLIVCADYVLSRVKHAWGKVYEEKYTLDILPTWSPYNSDKKVLKAQNVVLKNEKKFLSKMEKGDIAFLNNLYSKAHYKKPRPKIADVIGKGGRK